MDLPGVVLLAHLDLDAAQGLAMSELVNGVPADRYGVWCQHGKHLMVRDPADTSDYPRCIPAEPWPCDEPSCSLDQLAADHEADEAAYYAERLAEHWGSQ